MKNVSVVIPCHKEDPIVVSKICFELKLLGAEVIIVDDGNSMDLPEEIDKITYPAQMGYGYAIKQGIKAATNQFILTMDGDGQHTVSDAQTLYDVYNLIEDCDMLVGQRWNLAEKSHRWWGRKVLNFLASCISGHYLSDLNSGMRIFRRDLALGYQDILCDTFSFTTSMTMAMVTDGHKIAYVPINVKPRLKGKSHVKLWRDGWVTLYFIVWIGLALRTRNLRKWLSGR